MSSSYSLFLFILLAVSSGVSADPDLSGLLTSLSQAGSVVSLHDTMQCVQKLLPCKSYLNISATDSPPETCCSPLKDMVTNDFECLCRFYNDRQILSSLNITRHHARQLPKACHVRLRLSKCKHEAKPPTASSTTSTDSAATQAAAAAVFAAAEKSSTDGSKYVQAATSSGTSGSTKGLTFLGGVVVVTSASLFSMIY